MGPGQKLNARVMPAYADGATGVHHTASRWLRSSDLNVKPRTAFSVRLAVAVAFTVGVITVAHSQTQRSYDAAGKLTGSSTTSGATTRYYAPDGKLLGYVERRGTTTREYDAAGRYIGETRR